ncbi:hypothetical protein FBU30_004842 [Linnemannia zychae]|nr:hypothetical protein FBU30_004842 [Linnemannia zychae]
MDKQQQTLFAFGSNGNGQLGIASDDDTSVPQIVHFVTPSTLQVFPPQQQHDNLVNDFKTRPRVNAITPFHDFAAGGNHTALITHSSQELLMTGSNKDGETLLKEPSLEFRSIDLSSLQKSSSGPQQQPDKSQSIDLDGSKDNEALLTNRTHMDNKDTSATTRWRSVACGWAFTIGLTESNCSIDNHESYVSSGINNNHQTIYAWGSGSFGELGLGSGLTKTGGKAIAITTGYLDPNSPTRNGTHLELIKVRAGLRHVLLLVKETSAFPRPESQSNAEYKVTKTVLMGWGSNRQGQLGVLTRMNNVPLTEKELRGKFMEPTRIEISLARSSNHHDYDDPEILDMACGQNHSLVLFSNGTVYSSGLDKHGQLGPRIAVPSTNINNEAKKDAKDNFTKIDFRIGFEKVVGLPFVDSISCGWNHNAAMDTRTLLTDQTASTTIYLWGRNDHGQLGGGQPYRALRLGHFGETAIIPEGIFQVQIPKQHQANSNEGENDYSEYETLVSYSCGSEHTLAMTQSGDCYAWGWNEHGNCGSGFDSSGNKNLESVPMPRQVRYPNPKSSSGGQGWVVGGYGSSWVWT